MQGVDFVKFPSKHTDVDRCKKWVKACGRANFTLDKVTRDTYICTKHFYSGNGTFKYPDPVPYGITGPEMEHFVFKNKKRRGPLPRTTAGRFIQTETEELVSEPKQKQNPTALHDHNMYTSHVKDCGSGDGLKVGVASDTSSVQTSMESEMELLTLETDTLEIEITTDENNTMHDVHNGRVMTDMAVQTDLTFNDLKDCTDQDLQGGSLSRTIFVKNVTKDDTSCKFYTGVTLATLMLIFDVIRSKAERMRYWQGSARDLPDAPNGNKRGPVRVLSSFEEFLLTLVRIRRGLDVEVLADIFAISCSSISRIFITWINLLQLELKFLIQWPTRDQICLKLPKVFKCFPRTRAVIDCTEFFIQRPSLPSSQRVTWSSYKHHNTVKLLVSISPSGSFTFISKLWAGSASDKKIVEESGFLNNLEYGDDIMADRGFMISGALALKGCTLNIPPFTCGKQLSSRATTKTRRIARARIHVERAIGDLKSFKILQGIIPLKIKPYLDHIVCICTALCNLNNRRVK